MRYRVVYNLTSTFQLKVLLTNHAGQGRGHLPDMMLHHYNCSLLFLLQDMQLSD